MTSQTGILDADGNSAALSALQEFSVVTFTADGDTLLAVAITADMQNGMAGPGGMEKMSGSGGTDSAPTEYAAENHYTEDASETSVTQMSVGTDECIAWVSNGAAVTLRGITADRTSVDSTGGDNASFYGIGAAYLVTDGTLNLSDSAVTTDSAGGAGVFAYGGGVANVADTVIITKQDTSGGIHVAGGGTLHAKNLTVETYGPSSAAIRSDRGSGTMTVDGGTYTSNGTGSPAVYSTADITVSNAVLLANGSEAVCTEGKNSLKLSNCDVTSSMPDNDQNDCKWSVILYQSMSGDAEIGSGSGRQLDEHGGRTILYHQYLQFLYAAIRRDQNCGYTGFLSEMHGQQQQTRLGAGGRQRRKLRVYRDRAANDGRYSLGQHQYAGTEHDGEQYAHGSDR